ncbi:GspH/FimT family pseudopilin [Thalassotalea sp. LPB0316]|uniref:GspH/FimT family pseudopilin n=1 Tax=Thalassotalea sp. LPB0316 TaxID=2769490 RepID=UPI001867B2DB|nr:GspH/FimT family pseudopilin [Thalassotalea sp. LPB0316]QOL25769.1 GspH/FimT family pseudopilin [Thalassotalea sp. LPB0316]
MNTLVKGFTIIELMVTVAIIGIITAMAMPNMTEFIVRMRVDNEVTQIHSLTVLAKNYAVNSEEVVTICPLGSNNSCDGDWKNEITVFIDVDGDAVYEAADQDAIIKVKEAIKEGDELDFPRSSIRYSPTGRLTNVSNGTFEYCPKGYPDLSRGVTISRSGRAYLSSDTNNDGKEENRNGTAISCN